MMAHKQYTFNNAGNVQKALISHVRSCLSLRMGLASQADYFIPPLHVTMRHAKGDDMYDLFGEDGTGACICICLVQSVSKFICFLNMGGSEF